MAADGVKCPCKRDVRVIKVPNKHVMKLLVASIPSLYGTN